jgi:hypothetical protein
MEPLDLERVYRFSQGWRRTALYLNPQFPRELNAIAVARGEARLNSTLVYTYHSGSRLYDVVGSSGLEPVSDRVIGVLERFTGWTTFPVELHGKGGEVIPGYHGLAVTGRCGPLDRKTGRRMWRDRPSERIGETRFLYWFDPLSWDGSDIFCAGDTALTFVVEDLYKELKRAKITNLSLCPLPNS